MDSGIVPTMAVGNDGFGGNNAIWVFAILALMLNGFNGGNRNYGSGITDEFNFSRLENQVRANAQLTEAKTDAINNGLCSLGYKEAEHYASLMEAIKDEGCKTRALIKDQEIQCLRDKLFDQCQQTQTTTIINALKTTA